MRPQRRTYSKSFKAQVIQECSEPGASIANIALGYSLNANLDHKWIRLPKQCPPVTALPSLSGQSESATAFSVTATLWVPVQNGSKFTRGKKKVREDIAWLVECDYDGKVLDNNEYSLIFTYSDEADLKEQIDELFDEIYRTAEIRNCVVDDMTLTNDATNQGWKEYDGGWQ
ncbi:TPA: transposase [Yersinia enterocolitica]|nr:transposase [Yersinia enterocolitica]HEN3585290.1 transposase [Yersinia enterocolitica]